MNEKLKPPVQYFHRDFVDSIDSLPSGDRNPIQLSGPVVIAEDTNFTITESVKCNGLNHWKEQVTVNRLDNTRTVVVDKMLTKCTCTSRGN